MSWNDKLLEAAGAKVENVNRVLKSIRLGANVNTKNIDNLTPMHLAAWKGHYQICKVLIENGAVINGFDNYRNLGSPLSWATSYNHENVVRLLLEKAADLNVRFDDINTVLHMVIRDNTNLSLVNLFIKHGADVNCVFEKQTPLHRACKAGLIDVVQRLLHNGANIEAKNGNKIKPGEIAKENGFKEIVEMIEKDSPLWIRLHHASLQGNLDECKALLEQGALIEFSQYGIYCPITAASNEGHYHIAKLMLGKQVWVNNDDNNEKNPLYLATMKGRKDMASLLMDNGASPYIKVKGDSLLHVATSENNEDLIRLFIQKELNPNVTNKDGFTPLHYAAANGNEALVICLIQDGANANSTTTKMETPLHLACENNRKGAVIILLQNGANIEAVNKDEKKPVDIAKIKNKTEIVKILENQYPLWIRLYHVALQDHFEECMALLERGALVDSNQYGFYCPVAAASNEGHYRIVELLLRKQDWNNNTDNNKRNPLYLATKNGREDIVSLLIDKGASPYVKVNGDTLLHFATRNNHADLASIFIHKGVNTNEKNNDGYTPLHYAVINGNEAVVTCLLEHGAKVNLITSKMETPLYLACQGGHQQILKILLENGAKKTLLNDKNENPMDILNGKWLEMKNLLAPQNVDETMLLKRGSQIVDGFTGDNEDASGEYSDSDATVDYSMSVIGAIKRHQSRRILNANDVKELQSKLNRLSALIMELNDKTVNLDIVEPDLALERHALINLNRKMENTRRLKELKVEDSKAQVVYEDTILELTRRMNESKRNEEQLAGEVEKFQNEIRQLRTEAKKVHGEITPFVS